MRGNKAHPVFERHEAGNGMIYLQLLKGSVWFGRQNLRNRPGGHPLREKPSIQQALCYHQFPKVRL
jgi:hypothetical protein